MNVTQIISGQRPVRITQENEITALIKDLLISKFQLNEREWVMFNAIDGINIYADS